MMPLEGADPIIRLMRENDISAAASIEEESFPDPWTAAGFSESLANPHAVLNAAVLDEEVVGYACAYTSFDEAEIVKVCVADAHRRQGIGRMLLADLIERCRRRGAVSFVLEVRSANTAAIRLYEEMVFKRLGVRKGFYGRPADDAVIMRLEGEKC